MRIATDAETIILTIEIDYSLFDCWLTNEKKKQPTTTPAITEE
jgi:hypothetical protein